MKETKFKQTDIGLIPEDWIVKAIENVCEINPKSDEKIPEEFVYIDLESVVAGKLLKRQIVRKENAPSRAQRFFLKNDILYQTVRPYQKNNLYIDFESSNCIASTGYAVIRSKDKLSFSKYIYSVIHENEFVKKVLDNCTGTSYPAINPSILKTLQISLPPTIEEQERIANALSQVDDLLAALDEQIEKKKLIKQGAMQQLLTGKTRLHGFKGTWKTVKLGKIGNTFNGLTGKAASDFGMGNAQYITFLNVLNNPIIDTSILEKVNVNLGEKQNAVHKGDLFFNTSSETPEEVGICAVILEEIDDLYLNSFCFGFRLFDENVDGECLAYYFRSKAGRDLMITLAQGATRYNLSKSAFDKSEITIPSTIEEQQAIANILSTMDEEIQALQEERDKYALVKQGMMQQLLTGKIRLN